MHISLFLAFCLVSTQHLRHKPPRDMSLSGARESGEAVALCTGPGPLQRVTLGQGNRIPGEGPAALPGLRPFRVPAESRTPSVPLAELAASGGTWVQQLCPQGAHPPATRGALPLGGPRRQRHGAHSGGPFLRPLGWCRVVLEPSSYRFLRGPGEPLTAPPPAPRPRLLSENPSRRTKVEVSVMEVYNNDIFDLLAEDGRTAVPGVKPEVSTTREGRKEVTPLSCV